MFVCFCYIVCAVTFKVPTVYSFSSAIFFSAPACWVTNVFIHNILLHNILSITVDFYGQYQWLPGKTYNRLSGTSTSTYSL